MTLATHKTIICLVFKHAPLLPPTNTIQWFGGAFGYCHRHGKTWLLNFVMLLTVMWLKGQRNAGLGWGEFMRPEVGLGGRVGGKGMPLYLWRNIWIVYLIFWYKFWFMTNLSYDHPRHNSRTTFILLCTLVSVLKLGVEFFLGRDSRTWHRCLGDGLLRSLACS